MQKVVGVRFKKAGKIYYFDPDELELALGDGVIVETARGVEFGYLVVGPKMVTEGEIVSPLKKVIRKADDSDFKKVEENEAKAEDAFKVGLEKIEKHSLPMKLVNVELTFDNKKIIFYFTADGRVDFRELVKDLAAVFRTRIELRQIGVRDEAKMIGGLGLCGRAVCCHSFLGEFEPVSIRMAKDQNLSLNPSKISGLCGRLMCCLQFEAEAYKDALKQLPNPGEVIDTPQGKGKVTEVNPLTGEVNVQVEEGVEIVLNLGDNTPDCEGCGRQCPHRQQVTLDNCPATKDAEFFGMNPEVILADIPEPEKEEKKPEGTSNREPKAPEDKGQSKNKKRRRRRKPKNSNGDAPSSSQNKKPDKDDDNRQKKPRPKQRRRPKPRPKEAQNEGKES